MPSQVPAATRTLSILRCLASAPGPMTAVSIARELGLPRSSTYHLLTAMQELGFVVHLPEEERWGLGVAAFEIGAAYLRHEPLERLARPMLRKLIKDVAPMQVVVHLGVLHGRELLYLLKEQSTRHPDVVTEVGVRLPASLTASGRSILAQLPTAQLRAIYPDRYSFLDRTGRGPQSWAALTELLADEAHQGFSTEDSFIADDIRRTEMRRQWGAEKKNQIDYYADRYVGTNLKNPNFADVAESMGANGITVDHVDETGLYSRARSV